MSRREEIISVLADLVAAVSVNPPGNEKTAAEVVARYFDNIGIPYETFEKAPGRTNIIGRIGSGSPVFLIACHLDTVPVGEGWATDPFVLSVDGDLAYGRGANDNKAAMAGSLVAAKRIIDEKIELGGTFLIAGVADEECGNKFGATYLLEECGLTADYAIAPDAPSHMEEIDVAEKGLVQIKVECSGKAAHGSRPQDGANAVTATAELLLLLEKDGPPSPQHEFFTPVTMNVGQIKGGIAPNAVPASCVAIIDFRILPGMEPADIVEFVTTSCRGVEKARKGISFDVCVTLTVPAHETPHDAPLVRAAQNAARRSLGRELLLRYQGGITLAKEFAAVGMEAVALGPGSPSAPHMTNEWVEISEMEAYSEFLVEIAKELLPVQ